MIEIVNFFGFQQMPFGRGLAPAQLHRHPGHAEAVARLTWCIQTRGLGLLTGECGSGKTAAARAAVAALDPARHTTIYIANPTVGTRGIHHQIVTTLGGTPHPHRAVLLPQATSALAAERHERARLPILIVDESHLLGHDQLDALRMLTNADMDAAANLAIILIGQPTLRHNLKLGVLAALDQRVALRYHLAGMTTTDTADYINHHTKIAGRADPLYADDALHAIHDAGRGLPRETNKLALQALVAAYAERKTLVDHASARAAITEVTTESKTP